MHNQIKKLSCLFLVLLLGTVGAVRGQDFDNYRLLRSGSHVPEAIRTPLSDKIQVQYKHNARQKRKRRDQIEQERFFVQSNYMTDRLLRSGLVLFDDPVGEYLNKIKDYLLRDDERYRNQIHIYLVRSPEVNAFATAGGDIFVHLGLMAKLDNEAVLAYVISHEIQHVIRKHVFRQFEEGLAIKRSNRRSGKLKNEEDLDRFLQAKNLFSRKQEFEADALGLRLFLNSAYTSVAADQAMDLLRYSYLPYAEGAWDSNYFALPPLKYPVGFVLDSLNEIDADENTEDEGHTHPNIAKRREALAKALEKHQKEGKETGILEYLFGEEQFLNVREICRFELCHAQLVMLDYPEAIFTAYSLQRDHPNSVFLQRVIGQALHRLAKFDALNGKSLIIKRKSADVQGPSQQLYFFLENLQPNEMVALALKYNWARHREHPEDKIFRLLCLDLALTFQRSFPESLRQLKGGSPAPKEESEKKGNGNPDPSGSVSWERKEEVRDFLRPVFKEEFTDIGFQALFDSAKATIRQQELAKSAKIPKHGAKRLYKGYELGVDKVVLCPVEYEYADYRKRVPFRYLESEEVLKEYEAVWDEMARMNGVELVRLDYLGTDPNVMENIGMLKLWLLDERIGERIGGFVNLYHDDAISLAQRYGTSHVVWNKMVHSRRGPNGRLVAASWVLCFPLFPLAPLAAWYTFKAHHFTDYQTRVYDIVSGDKEMIENRNITKNPMGRMMESTLYNTLYQIKKAPRK